MAQLKLQVLNLLYHIAQTQLTILLALVQCSSKVLQRHKNLQVPGQYAQGTGLAGAAGLGSIGAGADYRALATSPQAQQAYMSPYMQNVVDVQKQEALRDAQMRNIGANLGAARQGTYGGARQLLAEQERNRNLQAQLANIQATGTQNAFQAAQQAQQFGTTAGLQGYGQAVQAAGQLGALGGQQLGAQQGIIGLQNQLGTQQQQQQQNIMNQAIQNYAVAQQYPQQQLAFDECSITWSATTANLCSTISSTT